MGLSPVGLVQPGVFPGVVRCGGPKVRGQKVRGQQHRDQCWEPWRARSKL